MKLIALCTIWTAKGRVAPGGVFETSDDEGESLKKRQFARDPKKGELTEINTDAATDAAMKAAAEAKAKADAEAAAKAKAEADAKAEAEAAAKKK